MVALVPVSTSVNPARIAREVLEQNPTLGGWDFARACADKIPARDREQWLVKLFHMHYSQFVGGLRNAEIEKAKNFSPEPTKEVKPSIFIDDEETPERVGPALWKQQNFWAQRIPVDGEYKALGDLTVADLDIIISLREKVAAANQRRADEFRAVRDYMVANDLDTMSEVGDKARSLLKSLK